MYNFFLLLKKKKGKLKIKINKNINILLLIFFIVLSFLIYFPIYSTFYQQDEWQIVGHMISGGVSSIFNNLNIVDIFLEQKGRILTNLINYILFLQFPFNIFLLATYSITFHGVNTFLVYLILDKILKNKNIAILAALFFLTNSTANQAVDWIGTSVSVLTATGLILVSLLYFIKYLETSNNKFAWLSYLFLYISFYFKEIGVSFFLLYFIIHIVFLVKRKIRLNIVILFIPVLYFFTFFVSRVLSLLLSSEKIVGYANNTTPLKTFIISNLLIYNFSSISQMIIPLNLSLNIANKFLFAIYPFFKTNPQADLLFQTLGVDLISIIISSVILVFIILISIKKTIYKRTIILGLSIIFFGILPYAVLYKSGPYLESRYYYLPILGLSFLFGITFLWLKSHKIKVIYHIALFIFIISCLIHVKETVIELNRQVSLSTTRIMILKTIKANKPNLSNKTVFYISSETSYIVSNMPLPFQQGIGYTLLVYLYNPEVNLKYLLDDNYLWNMGSQGYKEKNGNGFGYFYDFNELELNYIKNKLDPNNIYSFYWDSKQKKLLNNTLEIRNKLIKY